MNNLLTSIAFSVYSNKGVYALLLGSGISRSSGIITFDELLQRARFIVKNSEEKTDANK